MRTPKVYSIASFAVTSLAVILVAALGQTAESQNDRAAQAKLSPQQVASLQYAGIPVAVPTEVPPGFEATSLDVTPVVSDDAFSGGYVIGYRHVDPNTGNQICFEVEAAMGGFGGPVPEHQTDALLPAFTQPLEDMEDYTYQLFWSDGGNELEGFPEPILFSDWIRGDRAYYRVASLTLDDPGCTRLAPETANEVLGSLQYLE
ncbi:hypothetical protein [Nodosilinea sp. E11]|uniref:hypothetical protein n=1 Tax=Nodosilinea sp. E11 TaxID=3037479 RepID=UPI0029342EFE|nr:hypothetical protein [Nodosilinea sp. E11]WOD39658.1 hypothetical protein RRF56_25970 [Nodosilinea sp. E11]